MKVHVHVVEATATGTLSMVCLAANAMARAGHSVHVIYSRRPDTPLNLAQVFHSSVTLHELCMGGVAGIGAIAALRKLLLRIDPDIVHAHSSFAGFLGRIAAIGILPRAKLFYSPHGISVMREDIHYKRYAFAALERLANLRTCTYVACSESERRAIKRWVGADALVLENAVDMPLADSRGLRKAPSMNGPIRIITVGGIRPAKNPTLFGQICAECKRAGINAHFVWVGDGDADLACQLRSASVEVTGWRAKEDIAVLLESSDIYLSTSSWEGMPVSVIEAMASGTPVLATRCAGNVDVVEHGRTGMLFRTADEACTHILAFSREQEHWMLMARTACTEGKNRFSVTRFTNDLNRAYLS